MLSAGVAFRQQFLDGIPVGRRVGRGISGASLQQSGTEPGTDGQQTRSAVAIRRHDSGSTEKAAADATALTPCDCRGAAYRSGSNRRRPRHPRDPAGKAVEAVAVGVGEQVAGPAPEAEAAFSSAGAFSKEALREEQAAFSAASSSFFSQTSWPLSWWPFSPLSLRIFLLRPFSWLSCLSLSSPF